MRSLDELRAWVSDPDRAILDLCWSSYRDEGTHPKVRDVYFTFGKPEADAAIRRLTGNLIQRRWPSDSQGEEYLVTHLGAFLSSDGARLETLVERFLAAVKAAYEENHTIRFLDSSALRPYLDQGVVPLTDSEARDLFRLLALGVRLADTTVGGPQPNGAWYINIGENIDDIRRIPDFKRYIQTELAKNFATDEPVSEAERTSRYFQNMREAFPYAASDGNMARMGDNGNDARLSPWPVIRAHLLRLSSYDVPSVVDESGLAVDWTLTERENYSDKMRIAAYRPRIDAAYRGLSTDEERLRVAYIVSRELANRDRGDELDAALRQIGWELSGGALRPSRRDIRELFCPEKSEHDAYVGIRAILQKATTGIVIVDPYVDQSILTLLSACVRPGMRVRILSSKLPPDFALEVKKWLSQHAASSLEVRRTREFHDRFVVLDDRECWHIGCSIKDAGTRAFMLSEIEDDENRRALLGQFDRSWQGAAQAL